MLNKEEFDKLKIEFDQYVKEVEIPFYNNLNKERHKYQTFIDRILLFYFFTSFVSENKIKSVEKGSLPIMVLYSKWSLSLFGIYSCLQNGLISESYSIMRSLFENLINLELILKVYPYSSPYYKMKLYDEYKYVIKWRNFRANRKLLENCLITKDKFDSQFEPELTKEIEEKFDLVKSNYNNGKANHWSWEIFKSELGNKNPSVKNICNKLERDVDYIKIYSSLSAQIHSTSIIENIVTKGEVVSLTPTFSPLIISTGILALSFCSDIVKHTIDFLDLPSKLALNNFNESYLINVVEEF